MTFEEQLELGNLGEELVSGWLTTKGYGVNPSYEYSGKNGNKAPRLMFAARGLVILDLDVCRKGERFWLEIKTYWSAYPNRTLGFDVHGFPNRLYRDYLEVENETGTRAYVAVLEVESGSLLVGRLRNLRMYPCMCPGCRTSDGRHCVAKMKNGVYFARNQLAERHHFSDAEMTELRGRWPVPPSAKRRAAMEARP